MNKKMYVKPAQRVIAISAARICQSSVTGVSGNSGMKFGGGGSGPARSHSRDAWDEEEW